MTEWFILNSLFSNAEVLVELQSGNVADVKQCPMCYKAAMTLQNYLTQHINWWGVKHSCLFLLLWERKCVLCNMTWDKNGNG